jgi:hypothetical protein
MIRVNAIRAGALYAVTSALIGSCFAAQQKPNIVLLYMDDDEV